MTSPAQYYLGIDGGGTRCRARLCSAEGQVLGEGEAGPGNIRLGLSSVWGNITEAATAAAMTAGLNKDIFPSTRLGAGLAGVVSDADIDRVITAAPAFKSVHVSSDAYIACLGAFNGGDGGILIIGTGSAGLALKGGEVHHIGGWGFEAGDGGSAAALGHEAVKEALAAKDGFRDSSPLVGNILQALGGEPERIIDWINKATPSDYGALAPMVVEACDGGDALGQELVAQTVAEIDIHLRKLLSFGIAKITLCGGMAGVMAPRLSEALQAVLVPPLDQPVGGAVLLARRASEV
ncbi:BadF/BadG/BcrA/BcrD ATPase family protein [Parvularcula sp. LCG005]|uniref:BadF/BadG/BcrA/BcrD ATPase family protein n=1 Tax=Parvularcula sp. LCG005 TaxID=3078805 RepID=UPI0029421EA4|nr:BadF/BadG/BcrA/BcrD ATPase family protein [Parvularcula sp. LCG005]WOI53652.1 BadF/BadG/BcrA/BcrD ATPase family protein [Parvularcula sp. LCG005]